jgi:hypothetical protein
MLTKVDHVVNFIGRSGSPDPLIDPDTFSIHWTGYVQPEYSQACTFCMARDYNDIDWLYVNGVKLFEGTYYMPTGNCGSRLPPG